jgi:hypothetical protein
MSFSFEVGDKVVSWPVGSKPMFTGLVINRFINGHNEAVYDIEDPADGTPWQRNADQLERA